jgi:hypothetical protein
MGWKVTATKLFCDIVNEWVTVMVYHDGTAKCGHYERHLAERKGINEGEAQCHERCTLLAAYKADVFEREKIAE